MAGAVVREPYRLFADLYRLLRPVAGADGRMANERCRCGAGAERMAHRLSDIALRRRLTDRSHRRPQNFSLDEHWRVRKCNAIRNVLQRILVGTGFVFRRRRGVWRLVYARACIDLAALWRCQAWQRNGLVSRRRIVWLCSVTDRMRCAGTVGRLACRARFIGHRHSGWRAIGLVGAAWTRGIRLPHASTQISWLDFGAPAMAKQARAIGDLVVFVSLLGTARHVGVASGISCRRSSARRRCVGRLRLPSVLASRG